MKREGHNLIGASMCIAKETQIINLRKGWIQIQIINKFCFLLSRKVVQLYVFYYASYEKVTYALQELVLKYY